ncbi:MAG: carboxypeptidase-like regulatory domain-containing protein [Candidatus Sericytochromatia bacterium]|nr:carboxypeptidase-like regulatory domain-containing protein [Candidatus Sericytochromatia bacterium]
MKQLGTRYGLALTLALSLAACQPLQGQTPVNANAALAGAEAANRPAAGMGVIRGVVKIDTAELIAAGSRNYALQQVSAPSGRVIARGDGGTKEAPVKPDGSYSLEVPGGSDYLLEAIVPDGRGGVTKVVSPTPISVPLAQDPPIVDAASLVTRRTGSIQGLIELKEPKPGDTPEGADVFLTGGTSVVGKAGEKGRFALTNVAEGTWNVVVAKPGYKRQMVKGVAVRAGRPALLEAPVVLEREVATPTGLTGTVQSSDGRAILGATVSVYPKDRKAIASADTGLDNFTAMTDDQGRYEILNLPPGDYSVQVYRPFYQLPPRRSATVTAAAPQELGVTKLVSTVTYFGKVSGSVTDEAGKPLDGAVAQLDPPVTESQFSDAKGAFTLDRILPGEYNLTIALGGYTPVIIPVTVDNSPGFSLDTSAGKPYRVLQSGGRFVVQLGSVPLSVITVANAPPTIRPISPTIPMGSDGSSSLPHSTISGVNVSGNLVAPNSMNLPAVITGRGNEGIVDPLYRPGGNGGTGAIIDPLYRPGGNGGTGAIIDPLYKPGAKSTATIGVAG